MNDAPEPSEPSGRIRSLLGIADFRLLLATRALNMVGSQMFVLVAGWQVYDISRDPMALGVIGLLLFVPSFVLFPAAGLAADRLDRRHVIFLSCLAEAAACAVLLWQSLRPDPGVGPIYAMVLLYATSRTFFNPAARALLPSLVPMALFPNAVAAISTFTKLSTLAGPILGGVILAAFGAWVHGVSALIYLLAGLAAVAIRARGRKAARAPLSMAEVFGGLSYIRARPILLGVITLDFMAVLCGTILGLLPMFARDILQVGPEGLGVLRAMPAVGAFAVAATIAQLPPMRPAGRIMLASLAFYGLTIVAFAFSTDFRLSLVLLTLYGASDMISSVIRQTLTQVATPVALRGRVGAIESLSANGSEGLGNFRAGLSAAWLGPVAAVALGGLAAVGVAGLWWWLFRDLRRVDRMTGDL